MSSTDPQARVMKMADGGFRPAYNWEFAVDTARLVITGVEVVNTGSDKAQAEPMLGQVNDRCGQLPEDWLMDGGFVTLAAIEAAEARGVRVLAPVPEPKDETRDRYAPLPDDSPAIAAWRERMGTPEAKATYRLHAATVECVNAQARSSNGVYQVRVRGRTKVRCVALWVAIAHNLRIWIHLRPGLALGDAGAIETSRHTADRTTPDVRGGFVLGGSRQRRCKVLIPTPASDGHKAQSVVGGWGALHLLECSDELVNGDGGQRLDLDAAAGSQFGRGARNGHIIGRFDDVDEIEWPQYGVLGYHLNAKFLQFLVDLFDASGVLLEGLCPLVGHTAEHNIGRHGYPPFITAPHPQDRSHRVLHRLRVCLLTRLSTL